MKYVFLAYQDEAQWNAMSTLERDAFESACLANEQDFRQSGHLLAVEGLQGSSTAITVWVTAGGKVSFTDGPFAETTGQLIRLFFINAIDLNEAICLASKMPQARMGSIEVRRTMDLDQPHGR
jgi:hypothetical protein